MMAFKQFFILLLTLFIFQTAYGEESKFTFEPIYGVETSLVRYPDPGKYVTRATYGARVLYGVTLFSGEAEYTEARSREDYSGSDQKVEDTSQRLSMGLRSTFPMSQYFDFFLRAGGRATQGETKVETAGVSNVVDNPLRIDPYAGAGLQLSLGQLMAINTGATLIRNAENKYDVQYTLGLSARFGNR